MNRIRRKRKHWKNAWLWRKLFPPKVNERFCPECSLPFQDGPMPKELQQHVVGSMGAQVYPAGSFNRREFVVRFGRWRPSHGRFYCSEFIPERELADLITIVQKTQEGLTSLHKSRAARQ